MKRLLSLLAALVLVFASFGAALAQEEEPARVRVVHASPDAPAVDVWVEGSVALSDVSFKEITDYAELDAGTYNVQ